MYKFKLELPMSDLVSRLMKEHLNNKDLKSSEYQQWEAAFQYYNTNSGYVKRMGCRPCYGVVYKYLKDKGLIENSTNFSTFETPESKIFPNTPPSLKISLKDKFLKWLGL